MATKFDNVYNRFAKKIIKDKKFFKGYDNCTDEEIEQIVMKRCFDLLDEATILINNEIINFEIDFTDRNDEELVFNFELTKMEEQLISEKMYVLYFQQEEVKLAEMQKWLGNDIKMWSPAEERKTFTNMLKEIKNRYEAILDDYNSRLRDNSGFNIAGAIDEEVSVITSWI